MKTLLALTFSALAVSANAGTHVWSGAGGNSFWNNAANWSSGGVPVVGETAPVKLVFPANAVSRTSTQNINNLKVDFIEVDLTGGSYTFPTAGIPLSLTGTAGENFKVTGTSNSVTWQPALSLQATCRFVTGGGTARIDIQGVIAGNGGIVKTGYANLEFSTGSAANTFTGTLRVESGSVVFDRVAGTPCLGGKLELAGGGCVVRRSHQIPDSSSIEMLDGSFSINPATGAGAVAESLGNVIMGGGARVDAYTNTTITFGGTLTFVNDATTIPSIWSHGTATISLGGGTRTLSLPHPNSYLELNGAITDGTTATNLIKSGPGVLRLTKANTFSGTFEHKEGTVILMHANALGSTAKGTTVRPGARLWINTPMTLPAGETLTLEGHLDASQPTEIPGPVILEGEPTINTGFGSQLKLTGVVSGNASQVQIAGGGKTEWGGNQANAFTGIVKLMNNSELILKKTSGNAITGPLEFNGGTLTLGASHQIIDTAPLWFSYNSVFNVNSQTETVLNVYGDTQAAITMGDGSLTIAGNASTQFGSQTNTVRINGSPLTSIRKKGSGTWTIHRGNYTASGDTSTALHVESGKVNLQGYWHGSIFLTGGALEGNAITGSITNNGGTLNLTKLQPQGVTTPGTGGTLVCGINSEVPGSGFGQLEVTGNVNLTGLTLNLSLNYLPLNLETFMIIENDGTDAVTGTFNGLPEGGIINVGGQPFKITYKGGYNGNDVVLTFQGIGLPGPQITSLQPQADGKVRIDIAWLPGKKVVVERSYANDLTRWSTQTSTITLDGEGKATVLIPIFTSGKEFFRLRTLL